MIWGTSRSDVMTTCDDDDDVEFDDDDDDDMMDLVKPVPKET
jgi:hypothetical protein